MDAAQALRSAVRQMKNQHLLIAMLLHQAGGKIELKLETMISVLDRQATIESVENPATGGMVFTVKLSDTAPPDPPRYDEVYAEGVKWLNENG